MTRPRLYIFAKAPLMGQAKTRLAADIGPVHAKRIYRAMMAKIIRNVQSEKWETCLAVTPRIWIDRVPDWSRLSQVAQVEGSLTPRLNAVCQGKGGVVVIGTDSPQVTSKDIDLAFKALRSHEAVIGPADDGGFWLIGVKGPVNKRMFENVRWSTPHTLSDVATNIPGSIYYLRTLTDVDDAKALRTVRGR